MEIQELNGRNLVPPGRHEALCTAVRAKKRRGKDERYLSMEFDVDGKTIFFQGPTVADVHPKFKGLQGEKMDIKVEHTGVKDVRHRVKDVDFPKSLFNEDNFQVSPDKEAVNNTSSKSASVAFLDKKLRREAGMDGVNEFPAGNSFLANDITPTEKLSRLEANTYSNMLMFCSKYSRDGYRLQVNKSSTDRYVVRVEVPYWRVKEINQKSDRFQEFKAATGNDMSKASLRVGRYAEEAFVYALNCFFEEFGFSKRFGINTNIYYKTGDSKVDFTAGLFSFDVKNRHNVENGRAFNRNFPSNKIRKDDIFFVHTITEKSLTDEFIMGNNSFAMNIALMGGVTKALSEGKFRGARYIEFNNLIDIMSVIKRIIIEVMREEGYY